MENPFQKVWQLITSASHSRTFGLLAILVIIAAIPLTVLVAQRQQELRQRAEGQCSVTGITGWPTSPVQPGTIISGDIDVASTAPPAGHQHDYIAATLDDDDNKRITLTGRGGYEQYRYEFTAPPASTQNTHTAKLWVHRYDLYGQPVGENPNVLCGEATFEVIAPPPAQTYKIQGTVWIDTNENGDFDRTGTNPEQSKSEVPIALSGGPTTKPSTTTSNIGEYYFQNLAPGTYTVTMTTVPAGFSIVSGTGGTTPSKEVTLTNANTLEDISWGLKAVSPPPSNGGGITFSGMSPSGNIAGLPTFTYTIEDTINANNTFPDVRIRTVEILVYKNSETIPRKYQSIFTYQRNNLNNNKITDTYTPPSDISYYTPGSYRWQAQVLMMGTQYSSTYSNFTIGTVPGTQPCTLASASWSTAGPVYQGTSVGLNATATGNCTNAQVGFHVIRDIAFQTDEVATRQPSPNPVTLTQSGTNYTASTNWTTEWVDSCVIGTCDPEYFFRAYIDGETTTRESNPRLLKVQAGIGGPTLYPLTVNVKVDTNGTLTGYPNPLPIGIEKIDHTYSRTLLTTNGVLSLNDLTAGNYTVTLRQIPAGYELQNLNPLNPSLSIVIPTNSEVNFILKSTAPITYSIEGRVFEDFDKDTNFDPGERGIAGVSVNLYKADAPGNFPTFRTDTRVTNDTIRPIYIFNNLEPNKKYKVKVVKQTGQELTTPEEYIIDSLTENVDKKDFGFKPPPDGGVVPTVILPTKIAVTNTPTVTRAVTSTLTPTRNPAATITTTRTATPTTTGGGTGTAKIALTLKLQAIGKNDNPDPQHPTMRENPDPKTPTREIKVEIFNAQNTKVTDGTGNITYDSASGLFKGTVDVNNLTTGDYSVKVKTNKYLRRLIGKELNRAIQHIVAGPTPNQMPQSTLVVGDINNDNNLNIDDYNIYYNCWGTRAGSSTCSDPNKIDLNDDEVIDGRTVLNDYAWLFYSFQVQEGD